ncbi:peptide chain release factor N(5)-glutamine methyltransferase [Roseovarius sp. LXJ103]|nr:peptide chain release factor N(5)-glutamine methyltransferase [Roseovarius carneus]
MTAQTALAEARARLGAAGVPGAMGDARRLLAHAMGVAPGRLTLHLHDTLDEGALGSFNALVARRAARVPVSHLIGRRSFYGRDFEVNGHVLDPRPETETLVVAALDVEWSRALDLGTGSGAILLTLLSEREQATGTGTDISAEALSVAARNAEVLGVANRAQLLQSNWFGGLSERFDLIVSNPPYIAASEMAGLAPELLHEPRCALTDEADGLTAYRVICAGALSHLAPGGWLMLEIGWTQGEAVCEMAHAAGYSGVTCRPDMDGRDRIVVARAPL